MSYFNNNLPFVRKQRGISQQELAKKIGVDQSTISLWENGMDATVDNAIKVANVLEVSIPDFLGRDLRFDNTEPINTINNCIQIPIFNKIKSNLPIKSQTDILEYIDISKEKDNKTYFGIKITDDSMSPKYNINDIVIFEQINNNKIANNKDGVIMIANNNAIFKNIMINNDGITLIPLNINNSINYKPTFYNNEQIEKLPIKVIGIAKEKRTKL